MDLSQLTFARKPRGLQLTYYGNPVLRRRAVAIREITPDVRELGQRMLRTMQLEDGIGLAGPQVGESLRIVALGLPQPDAHNAATASPGERMLLARMPVVLVNPTVRPVGKAVETESEGCLSIPEVYADVKRPTAVMLHTQTLGGETLQAECGGLLARCLQHEIDHLDGVLFVDRLAADDKKQIQAQLTDIEKRFAS